jgi:hypothetical protein
MPVILSEICCGEESRRTFLRLSAVGTRCARDPSLR